jgi:PAS domain S-box-containing protein
LYNNSNEAILIYDFEGIIIEANPNTLKLLGYEKNEIIGLNLSNIIFEEFECQTSNFIKDLLEQGLQSKPIEFQIKKNNGELIWMECISSILHNDGKPSAMQSIAREITDRKKSEIQMLEYREKLEWQNIEHNKLLTALEQSVSSVIITNTQGIVEYTNPITENITGYSRSELEGSNVNIINSDAPDKSVFVNLWNTITAGKVWKGEFKNRAKDGSIFWEYATVTPVFNSAGEIVNFISIAEDITIRKEYELKIKESEQKNSALLNAIPDLMLLFDDESKILDIHIPEISDFSFINPLLIGRNVQDIENTDFNKLASEKLNLVISKDKPVTFNFESNNGNSKRYYEARMVKCGNNKALTIVRNITQSKLDEIKIIQQIKVKEVLTRWAGEFVNISIELLDSKINQALEDVGTSLNVDRVYLFSYDFDTRIACNTHEWCNNGISSEKENLQSVPMDEMLDWPIIHNRGENILIEDVLSLDTDSIVRQWLEPQGIKTLMSIPLISNNICIGFVGFDSCREYKVWNYEDILVLKFLAELLTNLFDRINKQQEKEQVQTDLIKQTKINEVLFKWASLFINLPLDKVDEQINLVLTNFGEVVDVDRAYIFKYDFQHSLAYNTHEWCKEGIESAIHKFPVVPFDYMMDWVNIHKNGEPVLIKDTSVLSEDDILRHILEPQGTKSALSIPIFSEGNCFGFVGFDSVKKLKVWNEEEIMVLVFLTNLIYNLQDRIQTQEELIIAKNKAEESDKLKSAFLANMSHEIRTPMNGIIGFSKLLMSNNLSDEEKLEYSRIIRVSSNRLIELINNILDISKIESGQMDVFNSLIDLNKMMYDIFEVFEFKALEKNLEFNLEIPDYEHNLNIVSDQIKLQQILTNLVDNAIKFTENGFVTFGYCTNGNRILFYVQDSGIGISESYIPFLYERFRQENLELSRSYEGSGLGLAIVKGMTDLIGAEIKVETKKEFGTKFSIELPIDIINLKNITKMNQEHIMLLDWRESVILIAEDDEVNYKYIEKLLARVKGITSIRAKNGKDAVEFATNNQEINLVLMDVKMPVLDGYSATKQIKAVRPDLPIIAVTAFAMLHDKQNALDAGCDDYISKPFEADDILKIINKFLSK